MHAISSYRGNRHRPPAPRPLKTHRQDRYQYTAPLSLARSVTMGVVSESSLAMTSDAFPAASHCETGPLLYTLPGLPLILLQCILRVVLTASVSLKFRHRGNGMVPRRINRIDVLYREMLRYAAFKSMSVTQARKSTQWSGRVLLRRGRTVRGTVARFNGISASQEDSRCVSRQHHFRKHHANRHSASISTHCRLRRHL